MRKDERIVSAAQPHTESGVQYHIACKKGDVARYVLLPGDPERVLKIARLWDEGQEVAFHREYRTWTGVAGGVPISACSTGIGGPSTAIAVEELARIGADTYIRVGTTGAIQREIRCGDLVISTGSVRLEGTSKQYVLVEYPAVASYDVVLALIEAAEKLGFRYHVGITATTDSFYAGQARPGLGGYEQSWMKELISDLQRARVLNFEMETATLYTLSGVYGLRAGAVCAVIANRVTDEFEKKGEEECAQVAVEAVKILSGWDEDRSKSNKRFWYPSLRSIDSARR